VTVSGAAAVHRDSRKENSKRTLRRGEAQAKLKLKLRGDGERSAADRRKPGREGKLKEREGKGREGKEDCHRAARDGGTKHNGGGAHTLE
jgi:hypothetical protein